MHVEEDIRDLLSRFIDGEISDQELNTLYRAIDKDDMPEELKPWFYNLWEKAPHANDDYNPSSLFNEIVTKVSISKEKRDEDGEYLEFKLNKQLDQGRKIFRMVFKYAAVFIVAFALTALFFQTKERETFISKYDENVNELSVPKGSKTSVMLSDGTEIWLNAESKLKYPAKFKNNKREVYIEGEGYFDVADDELHPFIVHTSDIKIKVLGTKFNIKSYPDEDRIETTLIAGSILIEEIKQKPLIGNKALQLKPNDHAVFLKSTEKLSLIDKITRKEKAVQSNASIKEITNTQDLVSWKENKLVFKREKFSKVVRELERWYNVHINLEFDEMKDYTYTGSFEDETIEQALEALRITTPFEYKINRNRIIITKP